MKLFHRSFGALLAFMIAGSLAAGAAVPKVEGTPLPAPPKPDWSSMRFLLGTWNCSDLSSRRPGPFTITKVYSMDSTGYWMIRQDTTHKASWIPTDVHGTVRTTYDSGTKKWVRISTDEYGGYAVSTAPNSVAGRKTYSFVIQSTDPSIASYAPEVYTRTGDSKIMMATSFKEPSGRLVTVKETCTKS